MRNSPCASDGAARGLPLQDALDALHRAGYTEERMLHFLRVLGAAFDAYVQAALSKVSLWREPFKKVGGRAIPAQLCAIILRRLLLYRWARRCASARICSRRGRGAPRG